MGASKNKKQRFLLAHPNCYFCGGIATTIDHVPSRQCFKDGIGPESYEFPACARCNNAAGRMEQVVALYMHLSNHEQSSLSSDQLNKLVSGVINNDADLLPNTNLGTNKKRKLARAWGYVPPEGETYADAPIAELPKENRRAFELFERRLTCAFYYKHAGKILPNGHVIRTEHIAYMHPNAEELFEGIVPMLTNTERPSRQNQSIGDQLIYGWRYDNTEDFFLMLAQFGKSFFIIGTAAIPNSETDDESYRLHSDDLVPSV
ncbi:hypothetical protein HGO34_12665 [Agrobacterium vitis]|uniref:HNH endonuclease n=1 Tax=Agrobacterium vitis TaxID=373 RepID=A0AAE4WG88_AGRVI|nr:hypothetical protein [Agrobacterium vitis]MCF1501208.1 hypothetical protein [Allorhizobium sp. Av2]MCM2440568.1 hypothetical protein [Agrobacterium vitis]MUZ59554.1 hypothetical protein [Agrobacterium vitis]MVA66684.1 hypothetical protein [Agrobacterium vitis]MVA87547.1 hypothetical protein [Agrobacterium vitis]